MALQAATLTQYNFNHHSAHAPRWAQNLIDMKILLRSAMFFLFTFSFANLSSAQMEKQATPTTDLTELTASLELSPEQVSQIETLELKFAEKKKGIKSTSPNADDAVSKTKALKASYLKELSAILNPKQLEKWKAMQPQDGK